MGVLLALLGANVRLATWNRQRSSQELRYFIDARHACLPEGIDVE